jgi:hypothetical protein
MGNFGSLHGPVQKDTWRMVRSISELFIIKQHEMSAISELCLDRKRPEYKEN